KRRRRRRSLLIPRRLMRRSARNLRLAPQPSTTSMSALSVSPARATATRKRPTRTALKNSSISHTAPTNAQPQSSGQPSS
ncbi:hypothetical protein LSUE1_G008921, partial [Lachnellula suecica]